MTKILEQKIRNPYPIKEDNSDKWISLSEVDQENNTTSIGLHGKLLDENSVTAENLPTDEVLITSPNQITTATAVITSPNQITTTAAIITSPSQIATTTAIITTSSQLADGIISNNHIKDNSISGGKIQTSTIAGNKIVPGSILGDNVKDSSLNLNKLNTRLKGVLIDSINPDDMIIGQTPKNILEFSLNDYSFTLSRGQITYTFYLTAYYLNQTSPTFFMKFSNTNNVYSLEIPKVIIACHTENNSSDFLYLNPPIITNNSFTFKENDSNIAESIPIIDQYPNFKILSEVYFKQYIDEFWTEFEHYITPIQEINLDVDTGTVSSFPISEIHITRSWNWYTDTISTVANTMDPRYTSYSDWLDFKNAMYLSQDDYDKLGIWIKI